MRPISRIAVPVCAPLACLLLTAGCSSYVVLRKRYLTSLDYAQPAPGRFRYVQRDLRATVTWDSDQGVEPRGSRAYVQRMAGMLTAAMKKLSRKARLGDNQALYNVRVSAPRIDDTYMAYLLLSFAIWLKSHYVVTVTADVIEFLPVPPGGGRHVS